MPADLVMYAGIASMAQGLGGFFNYLNGKRSEKIADRQILAQKELAEMQFEYQRALQILNGEAVENQTKLRADIDIAIQQRNYWFQHRLNLGVEPIPPGRWRSLRRPDPKVPLIVVDTGPRGHAEKSLFVMGMLASRLKHVIAGEEDRFAQVIEDRLCLETEGAARSFLAMELPDQPVVVIYPRREGVWVSVDACFLGMLPGQQRRVEGGGLTDLVTAPYQFEWREVCRIGPDFPAALDGPSSRMKTNEQFVETCQDFFEAIATTQMLILLDMHHSVRRLNYAPRAGQYLAQRRGKLDSRGAWTGLPGTGEVEKHLANYGDSVRQWTIRAQAEFSRAALPAR